MWIYLSLFAAMLWGVVYALNEQLYKHISVTTSLAIATFFACVAMTLLAATRGQLLPDIRTLGASRQALLLMLLVTVTFIGAELCIGLSIRTSNATLAALLEISYPLFTALFAVLIFKQDHITPSIIIGGAFMAVGAVIISVANR